ncbi:MAG: hypothetical protein ACSHX7_12630 [Luteolibacter sp.]
MSHLKPLLTCLTILIIGFPLSTLAETAPEAALAKAHGLDEWSEVEVIEFIFVVNRKPPVSRSWSWNTKGQKVTRTVDGKAATIDLTSITSKKDKKVHQEFINDTFWFLFPFNIVWSNPTVSDTGAIEIEIDGEKVITTKLTALWPDGEGYTPGDAYDLFLTEDNKILAWTFRRENQEEGKFFIWKDYMQAGPIRYAANYFLEGTDKPMISIKNVRLRMTDNEEWMLPTPR